MCLGYTAETGLATVKTGNFAFSFQTPNMHSCLLLLVSIGFSLAWRISSVTLTEN